VKLSLLRIAVLTLGLWCFATVAHAQSKDAVKYFPDNTQMVFSFNVKSLVASGIFQKHIKEDLEKRIKENTQLQQQLDTVNFDPLKDIHSVSLTMNKFDIPAPGANPDVDMFMVIKGAFNVEKINAALGTLIAAANQGDRVSSSKYGEYTLYEVKDRNSNKSFYGILFDKETIFVGNVKEQVTEAIERGLGKKVGTLNSKFAELMGKARSEATFWAAYIMPNSIRDQGRLSPNPELGDVVTKMDSQTLRLDIKDNVKFDFQMFLADTAAATKLKELADQAREMVGTFALQNQDIGSDLADLVSSIQVASKDNKVSVSGEVKADFVDKLAKMAKERR
jgi:hypothetical protein